MIGKPTHIHNCSLSEPEVEMSLHMQNLTRRVHPTKAAHSNPFVWKKNLSQLPLLQCHNWNDFLPPLSRIITYQTANRLWSHQPPMALLNPKVNHSMEREHAITFVRQGLYFLSPGKVYYLKHSEFNFVFSFALGYWKARGSLWMAIKQCINPIPQ